jgi:hypothetical protein
MGKYFDRYSSFRSNGDFTMIPGIKINRIASDKQVIYKKGETRLDILSQLYYNNPYHGFLIMLANPQYGGLEFDIKDRDIIIVPYPFDSAVERYLAEVSIYKTLYG